MFTIELADATRGPVRAKTREKLKSGVAAWEWVAFLAGQMRSCSCLWLAPQGCFLPCMFTQRSNPSPQPRHEGNTALRLSRSCERVRSERKWEGAQS